MKRSLKALAGLFPLVAIAALAVTSVTSASGVNAQMASRQAMATALSTSTAQPVMAPPAAGYTRTRFEIPVTIKPGANINKILAATVPKPPGDFYLTRMAPNLVLQDKDSNASNDRVPRTDIIHLHHMVWIDLNNHSGSGSFKTPFGAGEEKTIIQIPAGYGYPVYSNQKWIVNDMIHNLTPGTVKAKIVYDLDWTPMSSTLGKTLTPVYPLWMDVQRGQGYPVFNAFSGTGTNGTVTYPDQITNPYAGVGYDRSIWSNNFDMTLVGTAGHVHPGGLYTDLQVIRDPLASPVPGTTTPTSPQPGTVANSARLFRSNATYYDPAGPVSWDMSMQATPSTWKIHIKPYDQIKISATYDSTKNDWYESMGIMVVWAVIGGTAGVDPFTTAVNWNGGKVTHGSYLENKNYGGKTVTLNDVSKLTSGVTPPGNTIKIKDYVYQYGDLSSTGVSARPPVIKRGESLTFINQDAGAKAALTDVYHSITDCKLPCNKDSGVSYPLADGPATFDSGQLGFGWVIPGTPAAQRLSWDTPKDLSAGTYSYFCRIHPFMRGAFKVIN